MPLKSKYKIVSFIGLILVSLFFGGQSVKAVGTEAINCCIITINSVDGWPLEKRCRIEGDLDCVTTPERFFDDKHKQLVDGVEKPIRCDGLNEEGTGPNPDPAYGLCLLHPAVMKSLIGLAAAKCDQYKTVNVCNTGLATVYCFWSYRLNECVSRFSGGVCPYLSEPECRDESKVCKWENEVCQTPLQSELEKIYGARDTGILPPCTAFGTCTDVNQILETVVNFTREVFKYVGALAFVFFVYGGGLMVFSFGNAEKFKKGQSVLVAAVIGLIITFSASFMVGFLLDLLGAK